MVKTYDNLFDQEYFDQLRQYSLDVFSDETSKFRTNHSSWDSRIVQDSKLVLIHEPEVQHQREILGKVSEVLPSFGADNSYVLFYYWMEGSYIPWHNDWKYKQAATVYLNNEWSADWQGYFIYEDGDEIKAVLPAPNRAVHNRGQIMHSTTPVLPSSYLRATLQIFEEE